MDPVYLGVFGSRRITPKPSYELSAQGMTPLAHVTVEFKGVRREGKDGA